MRGARGRLQFAICSGSTSLAFVEMGLKILSCIPILNLFRLVSAGTKKRALFQFERGRFLFAHRRHDRDILAVPRHVPGGVAESVWARDSTVTENGSRIKFDSTLISSSNTIPI